MSNNNTPPPRAIPRREKRGIEKNLPSIFSPFLEKNDTRRPSAGRRKREISWLRFVYASPGLGKRKLQLGIGRH
jgi:hypothetical protein